MESFVHLALRFGLWFYGILLILAPFALRLEFRCHGKVFPWIVSPELLPQAARDFIEPRVKAVEVWGFDLVNYFQWGVTSCGSSAFVALLSNPYTRELHGIHHPLLGWRRGRHEHESDRARSFPHAEEPCLPLPANPRRVYAVSPASNAGCGERPPRLSGLAASRAGSE